MIEPLQLAAALDFLASSPAPRMPLSPAAAEHRRSMLEDTGTALAFALEMFERPTGPAHDAALQVFAFAADVWREYLRMETDPHRATLHLHAWAARQVGSSTQALPVPMYEMLALSFPDIGAWVTTVHVRRALPLPDVGTVAAWWAVSILAGMTAGPGLEDGEAEDVLDTVLSSLRQGAGRVMN